MLTGNLVRGEDHFRCGEQCVGAVLETCCSCVGVTAFDRHCKPFVALHALHHAHPAVLGFQDGTLLDVQLKMRGHRRSFPRARYLAQIADTFQLSLHGCCVVGWYYGFEVVCTFKGDIA